tara:strand:+ start:376 stop:552 length:177 start_codon:yes stop_codon:yes gene_type:complete
MDRVPSIAAEEWLEVLVWTAAEKHGINREVLGFSIKHDGVAFWLRHCPETYPPIDGDT